jgi:hypothetical protein
MPKSRPGRKTPAPPPPKRAPGWRPSLLGVVITLAVGGLIGLLINALRQDKAPPSPSAGSVSLNEERVEQWKSTMARWCPRLAALQRSDAEKPSALTVELATMECLDLICEHPEKLAEMTPSARSQSKPFCERMIPSFGRQLAPLMNDYRAACPEAVQKWSGLPWSPRNDISFHEDVRQCLERQCQGVDGGQGSATHCESAADLAEGFGDTRAAARLREQARLGRERAKREWEALPPEKRKEETRELGRGLLEACQKGNQRYCRALTKFCEIEHNIPDVCPYPGTTDAGSR